MPRKFQDLMVAKNLKHLNENVSGKKKENKNIFTSHAPWIMFLREL